MCRAIKNAPVDTNKKREIAAWAKILAELIYQEDVINMIFAEVIKMLDLEKSATYRRLKEEGKIEGIKEGIKEGEKQGKLAVAKKLLKKGISIDEIAEITELPKEEIKKLLN